MQSPRQADTPITRKRRQIDAAEKHLKQLKREMDELCKTPSAFIVCPHQTNENAATSYRIVEFTNPTWNINLFMCDECRRQMKESL